MGCAACFDLDAALDDVADQLRVPPFCPVLLTAAQMSCFARPWRGGRVV